MGTESAAIVDGYFFQWAPNFGRTRVLRVNPGRPARLKVKAALTTEPAPTDPNATHPDCTIAVAAAPSDTACANCSISIADAAYTASGTIAIKSTAYAHRCDTISVPATPIVATIPVVPVVSRIPVSGINRSRIPVVGGESRIAIIRRTVAIISATAGTLCLGRVCGE
jgi:hypothetical protein